MVLRLVKPVSKSEQIFVLYNLLNRRISVACSPKIDC